MVKKSFPLSPHTPLSPLSPLSPHTPHTPPSSHLPISLSLYLPISLIPHRPIPQNHWLYQLFRHCCISLISVSCALIISWANCLISGRLDLVKASFAIFTAPSW